MHANIVKVFFVFIVVVAPNIMTQHYDKHYEKPCKFTCFASITVHNVGARRGVGRPLFHQRMPLLVVPSGGW